MQLSWAASSHSKLIEFPRLTRSELQTVLAKADSIVLFTLGGPTSTQVNDQLEVSPKKNHVRFHHLGTLIESPAPNHSSLKWGTYPLDKVTFENFKNELIESKFHGLPPDPDLPYNSITTGVEIHTSQQTYRWYWEDRDPPKMVQSLKKLIENYSKPNLKTLSAEIRCEGIKTKDSHTEIPVIVKYQGKNPIQFSTQALYSSQGVKLSSTSPRLIEVSSAHPTELKVTQKDPLHPLNPLQLRIFNAVQDPEQILDHSVLITSACPLRNQGGHNEPTR